MQDFFPDRIPVRVNEQDFEILWLDLGAKQRVQVFQNGKKVGVKEFGHLTDQGRGVMEYVVKAVLRESGLQKSN